ncbi:MAG: NADH-ubiquinone oxidoreductase chain 5 [Ignavibacteria bacterium]|nr:MAG: NADH-ubiquinone oxidoreductase chain 5 [Ignavibacteria bacterium]
MRASLKTGVINRFGDVSLFFGGIFFFLYGFSWVGVSVILVGGLVKSAQFPFFSWLPAAMAAPTPVSALVHSSTLVTAGVWLVFCRGIGRLLLVVFGFVSSLVGGVMAVWEVDLKKVVAFSTLSQLGFMFFGLGLLRPEVGVFFLLIHAVFKALLFISVGFFIFGRGHSQTSRGVGVVASSFTFLMIFVALFSIIGGQFFSGFFLKHIFGGVVVSRGEFLFFCFCFLRMLTCLYSFRLLRAVMILRS